LLGYPDTDRNNRKKELSMLSSTLPMSHCWHIDPTCRDSDVGCCFATMEQVFELEGELVSRGPLNRLLRVELLDRVFYVKRYTGAGKGLRRYFGRSRVRAEWENLALFRELGIAVPRLVAWGEERNLRRFRRGAIVTEEVAGGIDMAHLLLGGDSLPEREWRTAVNKSVARSLRMLHNRRFAHGDLKFRNVLTTRTLPPAVYFFDCPAGRRRYGPVFAHWQCRDLAQWDAEQAKVYSRSERLRFYMAYADKRRLTVEDRRMIARVLRYNLAHASPV
jgi:hypothetical protein